MDIRLNFLSPKNFKGLKEFLLQSGGRNIVVRGDNGTGKSTLMDSFQWLLFGKNANNQADFAVKPIDENGQEIHFIETEVEAELLVDGKPLKLKKVLAENWVKPRGQEKQEFKGNETTYFFDEVPVKKTDYQQKVASLVDEETFKLITNPLYFNDEKAFPWQKRRLKLFEICGSLTDEEIIASSSKLAKLPEVLDGKSVDDRKLIIKSSIKKLNDEIDSISPKINENQRLIPEAAIDYSATEKELSGLKSELETIEKQLSDAGNIAGEYRKKQQELFGLKNKLDAVKVRIDTAANSGYKQILTEKQRLSNEKFMAESDIRNNKSLIEQNQSKIQQNNDSRASLIEIWKELSSTLKQLQSEEFIEPGESFTCPTCGQDLPEDAKEQKLSDMKVNFERNKENGIKQLDQKISANVTQGKAIVASTDELIKLTKLTESKITDAEANLTEITSRLAEIESELSADRSEPNYSSDAEYTELSSEIAHLQSELDKPVEDTTAEIRQQRQEIQAKIDSCNAILMGRDQVVNAKARIEELKKQEKDLAGQKSKLEGHLFLIEEFIRTKADMLSEAINHRFKHVRFKLFDNFIGSDGLKECCETLVNTNGCWVPYSDGNTAGKINAGIDIINSLIDFYGVSAPIFVDNAEAITDIIPTRAQVVKLVKPEIVTDADREKYSRLVVEVEG